MEIYYQGKCHSHILKPYREDYFTLLPGKNDCTGLGYPQFLSMPDLNNYILNDMLSIQCRLTPS